MSFFMFFSHLNMIKMVAQILPFPQIPWNSDLYRDKDWRKGMAVCDTHFWVRRGHSKLRRRKISATNDDIWIGSFLITSQPQSRLERRLRI